MRDLESQEALQEAAVERARFAVAVTDAIRVIDRLRVEVLVDASMNPCDADVGYHLLRRAGHRLWAAIYTPFGDERDHVVPLDPDKLACCTSAFSAAGCLLDPDKLACCTSVFSAAGCPRSAK